MRKRKVFKLENIDVFSQKLSCWGSKQEHFVLLNSKRNKTPRHLYPVYDIIAASSPVFNIESSIGNGFGDFKIFNQKHKDWIFGLLSYDLKNETENLKSENIDGIVFPLIYFFIPKLVFLINENKLIIEYLDASISSFEVENVFNDICSISIIHLDNQFINKKTNPRFSKNEYLQTVSDIKKHILRGDIYELNFCQEFYIEDIEIDASRLYLKLNDISPAPFSCFMKYRNKFLISSSPERYLAKRGNKLISQPIKGTARRGISQAEDQHLKEQLKKSEKERAENIMIVDLVRNDLSRTAKKGSVYVEELCEIYSFRQVHQMISTICSEMDIEKYDISDVVKNTFPMGSMTGAPKIKAMELIEKYEKTKRGMYSGSVGYISPEKDFDFNVIIRSILYNGDNKYLSFMVGSAITSGSDPIKEYEECLLKASGLKNALGIE
jgi:para-aminobenzoate synthetase component 1